MSLPMVDIATSEIDYSGGNIELKTVQKLELNLKDPKVPVKTMVRGRRPIGRMRGIPEYDGTLTVAQLKGRPEVDWVGLMHSGEEFQFTYEEGDGGARFTCIDAAVDEVGKPFDEKGETYFTVKLTFLDHKPEA